MTGSTPDPADPAGELVASRGRGAGASGHRRSASPAARSVPPAGAGGRELRGHRGRPRDDAGGRASALPPRGEATQGADTMTACERLSDRMPDVARGRARWTAEEAAHLAACADCLAEWDLVATTIRLGAKAPGTDPERHGGGRPAAGIRGPAVSRAQALLGSRHRRRRGAGRRHLDRTFVPGGTPLRSRRSRSRCPRPSHSRPPSWIRCSRRWTPPSSARRLWTSRRWTISIPTNWSRCSGPWRVDADRYASDRGAAARGRRPLRLRGRIVPVPPAIATNCASSSSSGSPSGPRRS